MGDEGDNPGAGVITRCLKEWQAGDETALARLGDGVYRELRRLAGAIVARQPGTLTIEPTALVHDLYLELPGIQEIGWQGRAHFLNVAAKMMRNILVDHARARRAAKRGGGTIVVGLDGIDARSRPEIDVLLVHDALDRFAREYPRQARVVDLRYFGGLTVQETAQVLTATGVESSVRTVERDWTFARAWLHDAIRTN
jgi:RNA polymerase sigma-70 factor (ECF subfamily)